MPYRTLDPVKIGKVKELKGKTAKEVAAIIKMSPAQAYRYQRAAGVNNDQYRPTINHNRNHRQPFDWIYDRD